MGKTVQSQVGSANLAQLRQGSATPDYVLNIDRRLQPLSSGCSRPAHMFDSDRGADHNGLHITFDQACFLPTFAAVHQSKWQALAEMNEVLATANKRPAQGGLPALALPGQEGIFLAQYSNPSRLDHPPLIPLSSSLYPSTGGEPDPNRPLVVTRYEMKHQRAEIRWACAVYAFDPLFNKWLFVERRGKDGSSAYRKPYKYLNGVINAAQDLRRTFYRITRHEEPTPALGALIDQEQIPVS